MADYDINLGGNLSAKALEGAKSIDTLTGALKAEQKALAATQTQLARMQAGSKVDIGLVAKAREGAQRIDNLKRHIAEARADGQRPTKLGFIEAVEKSGGPIGGLIRNAKAAWEALRASPSAAVAVGLVGLTAVVVSLSAKLISLAKDAGTFAVGLADSARSARLLNEAADIAGGTHKQLGGIIEDVRRRSDIGRGVLAGYARDLRKLGFDSRQTQVTLSGMATAEGALGEGGGVQTIAEQSRAMRRFALGARDAYGEYSALRKIGLTKADVFGELARSSGKSIASVQMSVAAGQVSVTRGMAAIDAALQRKFGGTVKAQSLSITSQFRRMQEDFEGLFSGASIEPLLNGLKSITTLFSQDTASGRAFAAIVTSLMTSLGDTISKLAPDIRDALLGLSADAAKPGGLATTIRGWINDAKDLGSAVKDIADGVRTIASVASGAKDVFKFFVRPKSVATATGITMPEDAKADALKAEATASGRALVAGIAAGVKAGEGEATGAISSLARTMQATFKAVNEIKSPSRAYARDSEHIPEGAGMGVRRKTPIAVDAVVDMSARMRDAQNLSASSGSASAPPSKVEVRIIPDGSAFGEWLAQFCRIEVISLFGEIVNTGPAPRPA